MDSKKALLIIELCKFVLLGMLMDTVLLLSLVSPKRRRLNDGSKPSYSLKERLPARIEYLDRLTSQSERRCINLLRMGRNALGRLCIALGRPPRAFENIGLDGQRIPTIDELIADIVNEEKRIWERDQKKKMKTAGVIQEYVPADVMSTSKGRGRELVPAREVLVISPELNRNGATAESSQGNVRAKRCLSFSHEY